MGWMFVIYIKNACLFLFLIWKSNKNSTGVQKEQSNTNIQFDRRLYKISGLIQTPTH